jgi:DNA-binding NarL/FixJ family response regulator
MAVHLHTADADSRGRTAAERIRVLLVDPHPAMRHSLRLLLEDARIEVVAEADAIAGAVPQIARHDPHAVVLDFSFHSGDSMRSLRWLSDSVPAIAIVAVTMHDDRAFERAAIQAGASAVVLKDIADPALPRAIIAAV